MEDYQVSIITPLRNVDLNIFECAIASMKNQTIGFESIQWIIVAHNCSDGYKENLEKRVGKYRNVQLLELNNDGNTASSPRNYGMDYATAPYIGFLDGDDSYTDDCLKKAINEIKSADAQIALFRMEYELKDSTVVPISDMVLWNQCDERVIIEKGNWDYERMFFGMFGWITSRIFDREFLVENNIRFDKELGMGEDFYMFLHACSQADRIVYLPQLIGYHYLINANSTIQGKKDGETIVRYARGMKKLYAFMEKSRIKSDFIQSNTLRFCRMILNSESLTKHQRRQISELLGPYVDKFTPLEINKLWTPEMAEEAYVITKAVIAGTADSELNGHEKEKVMDKYHLAAILRKNADTDYGEKYAFKDIRTVKEYQQRVPFMSYQQLDIYVRLQTNIGEKEILTAERITRYYIKQSGTRIPSTDSHFNSFVKAFASVLSGKKNVLLSSINLDVSIANDQASVTTLESALLIEYFTKIYYSQKETELTSPVGVYFDDGTGKEELYTVLLKDALMHPEIEQIVALNTDEVEYAFEILKAHWRDIVSDIRTTDPQRADELSSIFAKGFNNVAPAIWPRLERVIAAGIQDYTRSCESLKYYLGGVPHNHGIIYTEEALLGRAVSDGSNLFECAEESEDFFEFYSLKNNATQLLSEIVIGEPYQIVLTNRSGLYRYRTDHTIVLREIGEKKYRYSIYGSPDKSHFS